MTEADCRELVAKLYQLIDSELAPEDLAALRKHLQGCGDCLDRVHIEERFKLLIKTKCGEERVPDALVEKVRAALEAELR